MKNKIINAHPIHSGAVTHHQDQSITLHNFRPKNNKNNKLEKLTLFDILN